MMSSSGYTVAIVGATGAVGQELLALLPGRSLPVARVRALASARSAGKTLVVGGTTVTVEETTPESFAGVDVAVFSAGGGTSRALAPEAVRRGCVVIDNSSAFRMDPGVPLVVPEINGADLDGHRGLIANPNCSTAIALMALAPLDRAYGLVQFVACTYQAVSGTGAAAVAELRAQLEAEARGEAPVARVYPHPIAANVLPHVDVFLDDGWTREERKMLHESRKILGRPALRASATCVRVPTWRSHAIAVHAGFERPVDVAGARAAIAAFPGAELADDPARFVYPMPRTQAGREPCAVGRLRLDDAFPHGLAFFVCGDQLWKGAALNALQIADALHARALLAPGVWKRP